MIDAARVGGERPSYSILAESLCCDKSEVGRFRSGERRMDLDELVDLTDRYGVEVLAPLVERVGGRIVPAEDLRDHGDPLTLAFDGAQHLVELQRTIARAQSDNRIDTGEAADIHRQIDALSHQLRRVLASVNSRRAR